MSFGDVLLEDTIDLKFTTSVNGVPTTLAGTPVISAYVDNDTTELTAGITLTVDFDSRTGLHNIRVVATAANGYASGTDIDLVITTGTVGGDSVVGHVVGSFSIANRSAVTMADTVALPGQTAPPLVPTTEQVLGHIYKAYRNRKSETATQWSLFADDEATIDQKATVSDAAGTTIKQEIVSGP